MHFVFVAVKRVFAGEFPSRTKRASVAAHFLEPRSVGWMETRYDLRRYRDGSGVFLLTMILQENFRWEHFEADGAFVVIGFFLSRRNDYAVDKHRVIWDSIVFGDGVSFGIVTMTDDIAAQITSPSASVSHADGRVWKSRW